MTPKPVSNGTIDKHTKITLGAVIASVGIMIGGGVGFTRWSVEDARWKVTIERDIGDMKDELVSVRERIAARAADGWHREQMRRWVEQTKDRNSTWYPAMVDDIK